MFIIIPTIGPNDADVKLQSTLNCPSGHVVTSVAAKANCVESNNNPAAEGIDNKAFLIIFPNRTINFFICQVLFLIKPKGLRCVPDSPRPKLNQLQPEQ